MTGGATIGSEMCQRGPEQQEMDGVFWGAPSPETKIYHGIDRKHISFTSMKNEAKQSCC